MHGPSSDPVENDSRAEPSAPWRLVALLIAVSAVGPLSLNILMPAVPGLATTFAADPGVVQLTLTLYLVGLALSQLVLGPLSDRFGRRPVMIAGLAVTVAASFAALAASTITGLIVARTIQALGASTGLVIGRAIIRDLFARDRAAAMIGWVTMAMVVSPMIAPLIGGVLDTAYGWQATFAFVGAFAALASVWTMIGLSETRSVQTGGGGLVRFLEETATLVRDRAFVGYALCAGFGSAMFFAFLGGAPHVVVTLMGRSSAEYGIWFAIGAVGYMAGNYLTARWSTRLGVDTMVWWGVVGGLVGGLTILPLAFVPHWGPATIFVPQTAIALANGVLLPNAIAGAVSVRPRAAGAASGITGFLQMGVGALAAQLVGHLLAGAATALPMGLVMSGCGLASFLSYALLVRRR